MSDLFIDWKLVASKQMEDIKNLKAKLAKKNSVSRDIYDYKKETVDKIIRESNRRLVNFDGLSAIVKELVYAIEVDDIEMAKHYVSRIKIEHTYVINKGQS